MRVFLVFAAALLACVPAFAADEFGARFGGNTPLALEDTSEAVDPAGALQGLEPAAGDEATDEQTPAQDSEALADQPEALLPKTEPQAGALAEDPAQAVLKTKAEEINTPALPESGAAPQ